ncbi:hypothetical protein PCASD_01051 [Puccinia coronata f. sp. avenae]|uniref:CCHC-type domain-containing protein n=1 Tax=Puccinia coronata f. sp. avenae TaxID=200324 RepID=A0A2N5VMQ2_9BASI|nr:hypothetical protein PCASD_01051 [Puccinia coronata f. sp. avenae]
MKLMDSEVEFAAKTAMKHSSADMSEFINILEDISDKTRLGRRRFIQRSAETGKALATAPGIAAKGLPGQLKCFLCKEKGHTSRRCPKRVNAVEKDEPPLEDDCPSEYDPEGPIIGGDSNGTFVVSLSAGKNNLVRMRCCDLDCLVLLGSGAVRSVVGKHYLALFCPGWKKYILPIEPGKFHSASGALLPLGVVNIKLYLGEAKLVIQFVVMDNVRAQYFIMGNDRLARFRISLLNGNQRQFTVGKRTFDFDESINVIVAATGTFAQQVLSESKISPDLAESEGRGLLEYVSDGGRADVPIPVVPALAEEDGEAGYPSKILDEKLTRVQGVDTRLYLTRFKNKPADADKWLPKPGIKNADTLLRRFRAKKRNPEALIRAVLFCGGKCQLPASTDIAESQQGNADASLKATK